MVSIANVGEVEQPKEATQVVTRRETLVVVKFSFDSRYTWDFIFMGSRIAAYMKDDQFMLLVSLREELFGAGDSLDVDLDIAQQWNEAARCWVNRQYQIPKVHQHIGGTNQHIGGTKEKQLPLPDGTSKQDSP